MQSPQWTFLTNHGRVLSYLAKNSQATTREIAQEIGITERAVQQIIRDLDQGGYIVKHKVGRCNNYSIRPLMPLRHRMDREYAVGNLLVALGWDPEKSS